MKKLFLIVALLWSLLLNAQDKSALYNHKNFVKVLSSAKDSLYNSILSVYDHEIARNPDDAKLQLERCRFIYSAYDDESGEYNPKYDEAEACAQQVILRFPRNPEVLLYGTEYLWGDSATSYLRHLHAIISDDAGTWVEYEWQVYKQLAEAYDREDDYDNALSLAEMAMNANDTLDLTLLLGRSLNGLNRKEDAIRMLVSKIDSTDDGWDLSQKGQLLLELGAADEAVKTFRLAMQDTGVWLDGSVVAKALIDNGLAEEARPYLLKDAQRNTWTRPTALLKLLKYDLSYGDADSAVINYRKLVKDSFTSDVFGVFRLRLFAKAPFAAWTPGDAGRVLLLVALLLVAIIIPYLWVLPIHTIGSYLKGKGNVFPESTFRWSLRHFWIACSLWLVVDVAALLVFDYDGVIAMFADNITVDETNAVSLTEASTTLFFCTGILIGTMAFVRKSDIQRFYLNLRANTNSIWLGLGLAFLLKFGTGIYLGILSLMGISINDSAAILGINESIKSIIIYYHPALAFLLVVILVPIYEEILFRGIMLSGTQRYMKFMYANILQSLLFALLHQNLKMIPFYFAFGMVAGYYMDRRQSLVVGTAMHVMNNLLAFLVIWARA